ncbi:GNAT family N-acetyltransferase [Pontiellaceae bacterium B12227]|nr:GNAT family N-acetyltransferase [Pontiellaceae bacterium B12227]
MNTLTNVEDYFESTVHSRGAVPNQVLLEYIQFRNEIYLAEGYVSESEQSSAPDDYDAQSAHIGIRDRESGKLAGYCRMIYGSPVPTPLVQLYPQLQTLDARMVEISRFSVLNCWRGKLSAMGMAPLFLLARQLLLLSRHDDIRQWGCMIDDRFRKLCKRFFKMEFQILDEARMYMGSPSVPCLIDLSQTIRNNKENPDYIDTLNRKILKNWTAELE